MKAGLTLLDTKPLKSSRRDILVHILLTIAWACYADRLIGRDGCGSGGRRSCLLVGRLMVYATVWVEQKMQDSFDAWKYCSMVKPFSSYTWIFVFKLLPELHSACLPCELDSSLHLSCPSSDAGIITMTVLQLVCANHSQCRFPYPKMQESNHLICLSRKTPMYRHQIRRDTCRPTLPVATHLGHLQSGTLVEASSEKQMWISTRRLQ